MAFAAQMSAYAQSGHLFPQNLENSILMCIRAAGCFVTVISNRKNESSTLRNAE